MWCIQAITPEFRRLMYDILDLYAEPYDPKQPVLGLDEKPKQLLEHSRTPIPTQPGKTAKIDYEYKRNGTANIFMCVEPKGGKRFAQVTPQRTKKHFAKYIKHIVKQYPEAKTIRIVIDNLNTHNESSLYETFCEKEAKQLLKKIEWHYTPKHASWLNVAEIEIGVMETECTRKRIKDITTLKKEVTAWNKRRNKKRATINWEFTRKKADQKLSKHYVS